MYGIIATMQTIYKDTWVVFTTSDILCVSELICIDQSDNSIGYYDGWLSFLIFACAPVQNLTISLATHPNVDSNRLYSEAKFCGMWFVCGCGSDQWV